MVRQVMAGVRGDKPVFYCVSVQVQKSPVSLPYRILLCLFGVSAFASAWEQTQGPLHAKPAPRH